jgi:hypothetical protein
MLSAENAIGDVCQQTSPPKIRDAPIHESTMA